MPAYKDEKKNTWYCLFYYKNWKGERKKKCKRGFSTKKEALEWESNFKLEANANMDMTMEAFVEIYFRDKSGELKERSIKNKRYMIEAHVLPYLIHMGVEPLLIKERLGHKDIRITLNTYGHLYPNQQRKIADLLDVEKSKNSGLLKNGEENCG